MLDIYVGYLWYASEHSYNWSQTSTAKRYDATITASAYGLIFDTIATYTSGGPRDRWFSYPLRYLK